MPQTRGLGYRPAPRSYSCTQASSTAVRRPPRASQVDLPTRPVPTDTPAFRTPWEALTRPSKRAANRPLTVKQAARVSTSGEGRGEFAHVALQAASREV